MKHWSNKDSSFSDECVNMFFACVDIDSMFYSSLWEAKGGKVIKVSLICVQANPPRCQNYCSVCFLYVANKINHLLLCVSGACVCLWLSAYTLRQCICIRLNNILDIDYYFSFFIAVMVLYCWLVHSVYVHICPSLHLRCAVGSKSWLKTSVICFVPGRC